MGGKGKLRNRRHVQKLGPLVIYDQGLTKAFRNIPGVDVIQVDNLNLLKLAPGGHLAGSAFGPSLHSRSLMDSTAPGERRPPLRLAGTFLSPRWPTPTSPLCSSPRPSGLSSVHPTARCPGLWSGPTL